MRVFFITDKKQVYEAFIKMIDKAYSDVNFEFYYSQGDPASEEEFNGVNAEETKIRPIKLKEKGEDFFGRFDCFFSWHCRQIFPKSLVENHRCINLHPSLSPYNRGWFPQVFSIYNGLPAGVTIHEMDADIDMGNIIYQVEVPKYPWDTAKELHTRISEAEVELVDAHLRDLLFGNYEKHVSGKGNINYKKDFVRLCNIDLDKEATYREVIDYLRAFSFEGYNNAFFYDEEGNKIYVQIKLTKEV